jgi:hypothetical protein
MARIDVFSSLYIPSMRYTNKEENCYLVYSDKKDFARIGASTAFEALEKSGIIKPYKIVHEASCMKSVLNETEITTDKPEAEEGAVATEQTPDPIATKAATENLSPQT